MAGLKASGFCGFNATMPHKESLLAIADTIDPLARRARAPIANRMHDLADRARRLPPLSAFGRSGATHESPVRSGVGMNR